jgi:hypothetical protein
MSGNSYAAPILETFDLCHRIGDQVQTVSLTILVTMEPGGLSLWEHVTEPFYEPAVTL